MRSIRFKAGDTILNQGEQGDTAFLIVSGTVEVSVGEAGKSKVVGTLGTGEVFGEMSLIDPGPRSATVKAVADTECVATSYDEFNDSIHHDPARAALFMTTLVRRLRQMNERMASMDPGKRGFRERFREWQKSMQPTEGEGDPPTMIHWYMMY